MGFESRTNLKDFGKRLTGATMKEIYTDSGDIISEGIWQEFETLVTETAQYTGSTAASWNVDLAGAASFGRTRIRSLAPGETPLHKGHGAAVSLALNANQGNLNKIGERVLRSGINVWNDSPGAASGVPEFGPLRPVNSGAEGAFSRFQQRVATKVYRPLKEIYV